MEIMMDYSMPDDLKVLFMLADWSEKYGPKNAEIMQMAARDRAKKTGVPTLEAMKKIETEAEDYERALKEIARIAGETIREAIERIDEMWNEIKEAMLPAALTLAAAFQEIAKIVEECADDADIDDLREDDQHDGAVTVLVTWLLPVPTLYELYGQGVDYGGPGPSRLALIRVTDDGLRRAETGRNRKD